MGPEAYPSGHTTAVMSFALALVIVSAGALAPAGGGRRRAADRRHGLLDPRARLALPERHRRRLPGGDGLGLPGDGGAAARGAAERRPGPRWRPRCSPRSALLAVAAAPGGRASTTRSPTRRSWPARWRSPRARSCSAEASRLPQRLGAARRDIHPTREDEQQVAEPVEVAHALGVDLLAAGDRRGARRAGRPSGRRAAEPRPTVPPGRTKDFSAGSGSLASSQALLEPRGLLGDHAQALALAALGDRDVGADVEEVVLDALQPARVALGQAALGERDAELRVELVDGPVGLDPRVRLRRPGSCPRGGSRRRRRGGYRCGSGSRSWLACRNTMLAEPGRWSGKPVRIRRGPATVTGEATAGRRARRRSLSPRGLGRRGAVGPEARRPSSDLQADSTLVERGGSQHEAQSHRRHGRRTPLVVAAPAVADPANVTVRVEGADTTRVGGDAGTDHGRAGQQGRPRLLRARAPAARSTARRAATGTQAGSTGSSTSSRRSVARRPRETTTGRSGSTTRPSRSAPARPSCRRATTSCTSSTAARSTAPAAPTTGRAARADRPGERDRRRERARSRSSSTTRPVPRQPVAGAASRAPGVDVTTDASGKATRQLPAPGTVRLQATKAGLVRSETRDVASQHPARRRAGPDGDRSRPAAGPRPLRPRRSRACATSRCSAAGRVSCAVPSAPTRPA